MAQKIIELPQCSVTDLYYVVLASERHHRQPGVSRVSRRIESGGSLSFYTRNMLSYGGFCPFVVIGIFYRSESYVSLLA